MNNKEVTDIIVNHPNESIRNIALELRELIGECSPDMVESIKWSRPVYSLAGDHFYLQLNKAHVNLGFFQFDKINEGAEHLEGTGKNMRHIKIKTVEQIADLSIPSILKQVL